jgi:methyl-accepting chemotaxis protein/methyl-accepting chemotaxis protein-2 (aspartate sensor receptor)
VVEILTQQRRHLAELEQAKSALFLEAIRSIGTKTHMLGLNATIETAHAGEAGKGFAVVATEVRQFASDSASTAEAASTCIAKVNGGARRRCCT